MQKALFPIKSLFGLKVLFLAAIFCWHSGAIAKPKWDLGWIGVQFFFMCSGFLVGYNFSGKHVERENLLFPFRYVWQKLVRVWPIHFLGFAVAGAVVYLPSQYWHFDLWFKGIVNLLLFQSWAGQTDFIMSFNGVSWFLSSLFFCYFICIYQKKVVILQSKLKYTPHLRERNGGRLGCKCAPAGDVKHRKTY